MKYLLPKHIFLCFTADSPIFLDLRKDKYVGMPESELHSLQELVQRNGIAENSTATLDALVEAGLLTLDSIRGKQLACVSIPAARTTAGALTLEQRSRPTLRAMLRLIAACAEAYLVLRLLRLERVIEYLGNAPTSTDVCIAAPRCGARSRYDVSVVAPAALHGT